MEQIPHYLPEEARITRELVEHINNMIVRGEPDTKVIHTALAGIFGALGQFEADFKRRPTGSK